MEEPELRNKWDDQFGDRQTELVLIGIDMNQADVTESLDQCLLTDDEMTIDWNTLPAFVEG
ncbi:GTP-binding protein [Salipaludibacillus sp. LMS25]|uniref:GTP-binding protein n=1 Tax=Salipaludibacillus sp. LMS25 TaxID=2924031 RepID=UPI0020D1BE29|nr:GTP-binding protein [Salipaludibacillus sp. LMS25]